MILMFVRILLSISSSSASTRLSSNAGALPSRASTSSSIEFIAPPAEPARSSHPARWARIRRTLFKRCPTNVRRVDKRPNGAQFSAAYPENVDAEALRTAATDGAGCVGEFVAVRRDDALVQLAVLEPQRNLSLERALVHEPIEEFVVHHLLNLADRCLGPLDGPRKHFLRDPDSLVEVDGGIHQPAGHEHPLEGWQPLPIEGEFPPVRPQGLEEPREIDRAVGRARVVRVPHQVVDLV